MASKLNTYSKNILSDVVLLLLRTNSHDLAESKRIILNTLLNKKLSLPLAILNTICSFN